MTLFRVMANKKNENTESCFHVMGELMFVGTYVRKVQHGGWVRFPKDWLPYIGGSRSVFIMLNPKNSISLLVVTAEDYRNAKKHPPATLVKIAADGRVRIPKELLAHAGIEGTAYFTGIIRTISMSASRPDCDDRIDLAAIFKKLR